MGETISFMEKNGFELWTFSSIGVFSEGNAIKSSVWSTYNFSENSKWWSRSVAWTLGVFIRKEVNQEEALKQSAILHSAYSGYDVARQILLNVSHPFLHEYDKYLTSKKILK